MKTNMSVNKTQRFCIRECFTIMSRRPKHLYSYIRYCSVNMGGYLRVQTTNKQQPKMKQILIFHKFVRELNVEINIETCLTML